MFKFIKNNLLEYIPDNYEIEKEINPARIFEINKNPVKNGSVVYLCERELRAKDNFALQFAMQKSKELNFPIKIIHPKVEYEYEPKQNFIDKQTKQVINNFQKIDLDFQVVEKTPKQKNS